MAELFNNEPQSKGRLLKMKSFWGGKKKKNGLTPDLEAAIQNASGGDAKAAAKMRLDLISFLKKQCLGPEDEIKVRNIKAPFGRVWRAIIAEFIATLLFVFYAAGGVVIALRFDPEGGIVANLVVAFIQCFALTTAVFFSANTSGGHVNPAVTLAFVAVGRIRLVVAIFYWIAQFGGAIIGALLLKAIIPGDQEGALGATTPNPNYGSGTGVLLEGIMTFTLVVIVFATAIDKIGFGKLAPLAIGFTIFIDLIIGWKLTGASMNPARSLGPCLVANEWDRHWIYYVGPFAGAIIAAFVYDFIFISRPANPNPFKGGTRMETEARPIVQEIAPSSATHWKCSHCDRTDPHVHAEHHFLDDHPFFQKFHHHQPDHKHHHPSRPHLKKHKRAAEHFNANNVFPLQTSSSAPDLTHPPIVRSVSQPNA